MDNGLDFDSWDHHRVIFDSEVPVLYKLTNEHDCSFSATQWGNYITHTAPGQKEGKVLCSNCWLHAYTHPVIAILLNPIHANFYKPNLWLCGGKAKIVDLDGKVGCIELTTQKKMIPPVISDITTLCWGMACLSKVYEEVYYQQWCGNWIGSIERLPSINQAIIEYCHELCVLEKEKRLSNLANCYYEVWAVKLLAIATTSIAKNSKLVRKYCAVVAAVANRIAYDRKKPIDLVKVAEEIMIAR